MDTFLCHFWILYFAIGNAFGVEDALLVSGVPISAFLGIVMVKIVIRLRDDQPRGVTG